MSVATLPMRPAIAGRRSLMPKQLDDTRIAHDIDRELAENARAALQSTGYAAIADLHCEAVDGTIFLAGELPSFYFKQIAQEAVLRLPLASGVRNLVMVIYRADD